jgi:hypothetical protein
VPIRLSAAAFAGPGSRDANVGIVTAVQQPAAAQGAPIEIVAASFDPDWKERGIHSQRISVPQAGGRYETLSRLLLKPGRYEIRLE